MNWEVYTRLSTIQVQLHWAMALLSFVLGIVIFLRKKGTPSHRTMGRIYVFAMLATAASAFFIRGYGNSEPFSLFKGFSFIHLLVPFTFYSLVTAIIAIRRGNVKAHKMGMIQTFAGALLIAGAFTFLPGRHMHSFFFADPVDIQQSIDLNLKH